MITLLHLATALSLLAAPSPDKGAAFSEGVKTSLIFRERYDETKQPSHRLEIWLRIEAPEDRSLSWLGYSPGDGKVKLIQGPPPPPATGGVGVGVSMSIGAVSYFIPAGGALEWNVCSPVRDIPFPDAPLEKCRVEVTVDGIPRMNPNSSEPENMSRTGEQQLFSAAVDSIVLTRDKEH